VQYGLLNAAIQSSQARDELAVAIATKAFYRTSNRVEMLESDLRGTSIPEEVVPAQPQAWYTSALTTVKEVDKRVEEWYVNGIKGIINKITRRG
jgi:hypothetical protein